MEVANRELAATVGRLQRQTKVHEALSTAVAAGTGEQGIADALNDLTGHSVAIEDRFGNLRFWAGPGLPDPYPKQRADQRKLLLHELAAQNGRARIGRRQRRKANPQAIVGGAACRTRRRARLRRDPVGHIIHHCDVNSYCSYDDRIGRDRRTVIEFGTGRGHTVR